MINANNSLVIRFAERFNLDADKLLNTLKATAFKQPARKDKSGHWAAPDISTEQMVALLLVADQFNLNPFLKEIWAFPDKKGGIVPVVSVDGWSRIINENQFYDGMEFRYADNKVNLDDKHKSCHEWIECVIYRKDRSHPVCVREYFDEVYRPAIEKKGDYGNYTIDGPWQSHPKRMLGHKALIQAARVAIGFAGIYDLDEAERICEMNRQEVDITPTKQPTNVVPLSTATPGLEQEARSSLDVTLNQLIERAKPSGCWDTAKSYVESKLQGADKDYALQRLSEAQAEFQPTPTPETPVEEAEFEAPAQETINQANFYFGGNADESR
ncbi:phage recombination protein Bet [Piscirickettsia litoralis]|uniref:Phage recombination protein Bet n=1 Tax=Piscirickettsia litoralis TaxID=1891921 RepID=A0ABX2ZXP0_9GAMM|nr:phage recombination protein Bet [Piscirickettsia litoralis]ODN41374.1 phage recombination protein Bet [Piscirickettsia litoralis]